MSARLIQTSRDGCQVKRWVQRLEEGILRLDQEIQVTDLQKGLDVTGRFWLFAIVQLKRGSVEYLSGDDRVMPPAPLYGIFAPPYSVVEVGLSQSNSYSMALASAKSLPAEFPREPVIFGVRSRRCPASITEMAELIDAAPKIINVGRCSAPLTLASRIKEAIDGNYTQPAPLSKVAAHLRISPAVMSRYFKKAYGMPPVHYRHMIRTMDGMMRLLDGAAIKNVYQEVGFDDLSCFYRHFKQHMLAPPTNYQM